MYYWRFRFVRSIFAGEGDEDADFVGALGLVEAS
jgi:hypothetical protein